MLMLALFFLFAPSHPSEPRTEEGKKEKKMGPSAMISYPKLPSFRTAGFTKWFVESFSVYRGLSKKELDEKQSPGKGLGRWMASDERKFWLSLWERSIR